MGNPETAGIPEVRGQELHGVNYEALVINALERGQVIYRALINLKPQRTAWLELGPSDESEEVIHKIRASIINEGTFRVALMSCRKDKPEDPLNIVPDLLRFYPDRITDDSERLVYPEGPLFVEVPEVLRVLEDSISNKVASNPTML